MADRTLHLTDHGTTIPLERVAEVAGRLERELAKAIIGQQRVVREILVAFLAGGHCLLRGVPGLAKTLLIKKLAEAVDLRFNRIQFTPDLMPSDILGTVLRLLNDPASASPGATVQSGPAGVPTPWLILASNPRGEALVRAAASGAELLVDVKAPVDSLFAAEVARAVLNARIDPGTYDEHEIARVDEALLVGLSRPPGPVTLEAWRTSEASDTRWAWLAALTLLGVEQWLRGRSVRTRAEEVTRAAA